VNSFLNLLLILLGTISSAWGASLLLRLMAILVGRVRRVPPFKWLFQGGSMWDPRPEHVGNARRVCVAALGATAIVGGWYSFVVQRELNPYATTSVGVLAIGALGGVLAAVTLGAIVVAWRADPARGRRRCPKCWYDFAGLSGLKCPECGHEAWDESELGKTRRSVGMALVGVLLLLAAWLVTMWPSVQRKGLLGVTPTWVLIAFWEKLPDSYLYGFSGREGEIPSEGPLCARLYDKRDGWQVRWLDKRIEAGVLESPDLGEFVRRAGLTTYSHQWTNRPGIGFSEETLTRLEKRGVALAEISLGGDFPNLPPEERAARITQCLRLVHWGMNFRRTAVSQASIDVVKKSLNDPNPQVSMAAVQALPWMIECDREIAWLLLDHLVSTAVTDWERLRQIKVMARSAARTSDVSERLVARLNAVEDDETSTVLWEVGVGISSPQPPLVDAVERVRAREDGELSLVATLVLELWRHRLHGATGSKDESAWDPQFCIPAEPGPFCAVVSELAAKLVGDSGSAQADAKGQVLDAATTCGCRSESLDALAKQMLRSSEPIELQRAHAYVQRLDDGSAFLGLLVELAAESPGPTSMAEYSIVVIEGKLRMATADREWRTARASAASGKEAAAVDHAAK
jgi:hypothetical protein